jgi:hypothetical protein
MATKEQELDVLKDLRSLLDKIADVYNVDDPISCLVVIMEDFCALPEVQLALNTEGRA